MVKRVCGLVKMAWRASWLHLSLLLGCLLVANTFVPLTTLHARPVLAPTWHVLAQESPLVSPLATPITTPNSLSVAAQTSPVSLMLVGVVLVGVLMVVAVVVWRQR